MNIDYKNEEEMEDYPLEIEDGDYVISSNGNSLSVSIKDTKWLFNCIEFEFALEQIKKHMESNQYWPNIFYVNDHGNVDLIDYDGNIINSRV